MHAASAAVLASRARALACPACVVLAQLVLIHIHARTRSVPPISRSNFGGTYSKRINPTQDWGPTIRCFFTGRGLTPPDPAFAFRTPGATVRVAPFVLMFTPPTRESPTVGDTESSRSRLSDRFVGSPAPGIAPGVAAGVAGPCTAGGDCAILESCGLCAVVGERA